MKLIICIFYRKMSWSKKLLRKKQNEFCTFSDQNSLLSNTNPGSETTLQYKQAETQVTKPIQSMSSVMLWQTRPSRLLVLKGQNTALPDNQLLQIIFRFDALNSALWK